jgi:hypothetical protein
MSIAHSIVIRSIFFITVLIVIIGILDTMVLVSTIVTTGSAVRYGGFDGAIYGFVGGAAGGSGGGFGGGGAYVGTNTLSGGGDSAGNGGAGDIRRHNRNPSGGGGGVSFTQYKYTRAGGKVKRNPESFPMFHL